MGLYPKAVDQLITAAVGGPYGNVVVLDPVNGLDTNSGNSLKKPLKTFAAAWAKVTDNQNDVIAIVGTATAVDVTAAITWTKSYTHLIGLTSDVYGLGQRARLVAQATADADQVMTISGNGCIFKNIQFNNEHATGAAVGTVVLTGQRNYFENCFFMAPTSSTAASFSLKTAGAENVFKRCTFGQYTNARAEASYGLWMHKGAGASVSREKFVDCEFLSWGATGDHVHVLVDADIATVPWMVQFEGCLFANVGVALTEAINDNSSAAGHQIILRGHNDFLNCTAVGGTLTYIFAPNPENAVSGLLMIAVAES